MWWVATALGGPREGDVRAVWELSVDGVALGTTEVAVRYEARPGAERVRILEGYTAIRDPERRKKLVYRQRMTADSRGGNPASFHSVIDSRGETREIQARFADGGWSVSVIDESGPRDYALKPTRVDLSTVDLFDPESERKIGDYATARVLSAELGQLLQGPVTSLGTEIRAIGEERLPVDGWQWESEVGTWQFWYAANGFLVAFDLPLLDRVVHAELEGEAPRAIDEFPVPPLGRVELVEDL